MVIVGVDPSSTRCGYGVIRCDRQRLTYVAAGVISTTKGWPLARRLMEIGRELEQVCREALAARQDGEGIAAGIEDGYVPEDHPGRAASALVLGAGRGVAIERVAAVLGLEEVPEYPPATLKKAVTGRGDASKELVALFVRRILGLRKAPAPDAADALACAITRARDL